MGLIEATSDARAADTQSILDALPQLLWQMNDVGLVTYANRACRDFTGLDGERLQGRVLADLVHPDDYPRARAAWHDATLERGALTLELRLIHRSGAHRWTRVHLQTLPGTEEGARQYLGTASDVEGEHRSTLLQQVTAALSGALTPAAVIEVVLRQALSALGAYAGYVALLEDVLPEENVLSEEHAAPALRIVNGAGYPQELLQRWRTIPLSANLPICDVVRDGHPMYLSADALRRDYPQVSREILAATTSIAALPLAVPKGTLGGLALSFREAREFPDEERTLMETLAGLCAQALERAQLYEAQALARADAERASRQQAFLDQATLLLTGGLNVEASLTSVAELAARQIGDCCGIYLPQPDGTLRPLALVHPDEARRTALLDHVERHPPRQDAEHGIGGVYRSGHAQFVPLVSDDVAESLPLSAASHDVRRHFTLRSVIIVPMRVRGRTLGVLSVTRGEPAEPYTPDDFTCIQELARRAALALDNVRLYRDAQASAARYRSLVEATAQIVWTTPESGVFESTQGGWSAFTGQSAAELLGNGWLDAVHPDDREFTIERWRSAVAQRHVYQVRHRLRRHDGEYRHMQVRAVPILNEDRSVREWVGLHSDITDLVRAEEEVRELNATLEARVRQRTLELEHLNAELETFTYSVSHDLQAPVRHILGFSGLLSRAANGTLDEKGARYLEAINEAAERMGQLIADLLQLSRLGRQSLRWRHVNLNDVVRSVQSQLEPDAANRRVEWHVHALPTVTADPALLSVAFTNLLGNALKYTRPRDVARIEVWAERTTNETVVHVRDNGVGFDPKWQDRLFGAFQRLHSPQDFEGNGVGLANVRRAIHRHGGRTWAEGQTGVGATFSFSLPDELPDA